MSAQLDTIRRRTQLPPQEATNGTGEDRNRSFTIRELTKEFGLTARALRFYEDEGLISPARRGQTRIYSRRDRARLALISRGRRVGLSLAVIGEILDLHDRADGGVRQRAHARAKLVERIDTLQGQKTHIERTLSELRQAVAQMDDQRP